MIEHFKSLPAPRFMGYQFWRIALLCFYSATLFSTLTTQAISQQSWDRRVINVEPFQFDIDDPVSNNTAGLMGKVLQLNPPGKGYARLAVEFALRTGTPLTYDLDVDFTLSLHCYNRSAPQSSVRVTIPKGSIRSIGEILVPIPSQVNSVSFSTSVDGREVPGLSSGQRYRPHEGTQTSYVILNTLSELNALKSEKDVRYFGPTKLGDQKTWATKIMLSREANGAYYAYNEGENSARAALATECPTNPLDLTTVTTMVSSLQALSQLNELQSECLRQYVRNGGTLIVLASPDPDGTKKEFQEWLGGITSPIKWEKREFYGRTQSYSRFGLGGVAVFADIAAIEVIRSGELRNFPNNPSAGYRIESNRVDRVQQQGFWKWSLQQLGQPPVAAFAALIGIFAGIASPALLIFCIRSNRSAWLMVILPLMAIVGTSCLIVFATIHDGFGTYSRIRSLTILDRNAGVGSCLSRQVFFCGLQPSEGVIFESDSEVWLIESDNSSGYERRPGGRIDWSNNRQTYLDLVKAREQFQFSVTQPIKDLEPIEWVKKPDTSKDSVKPSTPSVCEFKNVLEEPIRLVVVCDGLRGYYIATDIAAGATAMASAIDEETAIKTLRAMENSQQLRLPAGLSGETQVDMVDAIFGRNAYMYQNYNTYNAANDFYDQLRDELLMPGNLANQRCFILYPAEGKYVDRALEDTDEQGSLHMIYGLWSHTNP